MRISSLIPHRTSEPMEQYPAAGVVAPLIAAAAGAGGVGAGYDTFVKAGMERQ